MAAGRERACLEEAERGNLSVQKKRGVLAGRGEQEDKEAKRVSG